MRIRLVGGVLWAILGTALPTYADAIRITGGVLSGSDSSVNDFLLLGPAFRINGLADGVFDREPAGEPHWRCDPLPCVPGSPLDLSSNFTGDLGEATIDGVNYYPVQSSFEFKSSSITIPDLPIGAKTTFFRPFTFTGRVWAFRDGALLFSHDLSGSGTVVLDMNRWDPSLGVEGMNASRTQYRFEADAAPVPEPGSMLLLGSGLASVMAAHRRRTRR
jgi:hypothetical protein